jgi:hypothetical protein
MTLTTYAYVDHEDLPLCYIDQYKNRSWIAARVETMRMALPDALRLLWSWTGWDTLWHDGTPGCLFHGLNLFPVLDLLDADFAFNQLVDISDDDGSLNIHQRERWNWVTEIVAVRKKRLELIARIVTRCTRLSMRR